MTGRTVAGAGSATWGGTPDPHGTLSSRYQPAESSACHWREAGQGPAADEGVRPTICADTRQREEYSALGPWAGGVRGDS